MNTDKMKNLAVNDNGFVFDPSSGYSYSVNPTGLLLIKLLSQGMNKEDIYETVCAEYDVSSDNIASDYEHYLLMLEALDLVEL